MFILSHSRYGIAGIVSAMLILTMVHAEAKSPPSFAGVWKKNTPFTDPFRMVDASLYKPEYAKAYAASKKAVEEGSLDLGAACSPPGMVRTWEVGQFEVLDAPKGRITILYEFMSQVRRINIGREHPTPLDPSVNGDSVAHWEGNTLVVDTKGISEFSFLDRNAAPHSDQLQVTERFSLVNPNLLKVDTTVADATALSKPWQFSTSFDRVPDGELIDYECTENPRNPINADGSVGFQFEATK